MQENIELRKVRDFGELINDTFVFVKQNFKPLLRAYVTICGFFILALIVTSVLQQLRMQDEMSQRQGIPQVFGTEYFLAIIFAVIAFIAISVTTFSYVSLYRDKGNQAPSVEEVWGYFKYFFFRVFTAQLLLGVLLVLGFALCFLPGIYLLPIISLILAIMVFENCGVSNAFDRGFKLIKNNWWTTFGALFVIYLAVSFASMIFSVPTAVLSVGSLFLANKSWVSPLLIVTTIGQALCYVFMILPTVVISLSYFSLVESKEGMGLMDRVNMIGKNDVSGDHPEEQY